MNRHRLARSMGFRSYEELLEAARRGKEYKDALRKERDGHAGFVMAGEAATKERVTLARVREDLAEAFEALAGTYGERALRAERDAAAARALERHYRDVATAIRAGSDLVIRPKEQNRNGQATT